MFLCSGIKLGIRWVTFTFAKEMTMILKQRILLGVLAIVVCCCGCNEKQKTGDLTKNRASSPEKNTTEATLILGNMQPTTVHEEIDELTFGETLDDVTQKLGRWDMVGDMMADGQGQFYPFSDRDGIDYIVRVAPGGKVNGVWKRLRVNQGSEQDGTDQPTTAPESKPESNSKPKSESEGHSQ